MGHWIYNQTWQTKWKTASLAIVQLCEYENQTLEAFVAPVTHRNLLLLLRMISETDVILPILTFILDSSLFKHAARLTDLFIRDSTKFKTFAEGTEPA